MATATVSTIESQRVTQPSYIYAETDPYERIAARLGGLRALTVVASTALESDSPPTELVWQPLLYAIGILTEDIDRDLRDLDHFAPSTEDALAKAKLVLDGRLKE
jgi:hypothetical protein